MDFGIVYKMTGGRMFFIVDYINQVNRSGYFDDPERFRPVQNEYSRMLSDSSEEAKTYGEWETLTVCRLLLDSPLGYISYIGLVKKLGLGVVKEMLERNLIQYRPSSHFSKDLIPPPSESVVTPQSQPALCAMKMLVKEMEPV
ncbi:hypothetical protein H4Q26_001538 [Puccinia striiformis f. sp. tritici PST-130]|uniref:Uncharacterized protein n=2 Tax=Puccinia striiformis f. sp. tritici TaxID=168172 RepID=A0A0L0UZH6_9BASI|nr:hypothetical protein H4Q26_001538 [Puccinia striiformis f. sp. tritici PST-130]KNE92425.1 hypothetical protein PSTG_14146 [Puccinia striiformis f. sp. tritici PST-78]